MRASTSDEVNRDINTEINIVCMIDDTDNNNIIDAQTKREMIDKRIILVYLCFTSMLLRTF